MTPEPLNAVELRDSARRAWRVEARRDPRRGRILVLRPAHGDNEPFRASADGWRPDTHLAISAEDFDVLARLVEAGPAADDALRNEAFRRVDRMVVAAQHQLLMGASEDEDDDDEADA